MGVVKGGCDRPAILVVVGRYGLSTSWPDLFRPSPQHGAAMDGRDKSGHDDVATRWGKMRIAAEGQFFSQGGPCIIGYAPALAGLGREEQTEATKGGRDVR